MFCFIVKSREEAVFFCIEKEGELFFKIIDELLYCPGLGLLFMVSLNLFLFMVFLGPAYARGEFTVIKETG